MEIMAKQPEEESYLRATVLLQSLGLGGRGTVYPKNRLLLRPRLKSGFLAKTSLILALPLRLLVWVYQKTISPDHGLPKGLYPYGYCKFYPSCSAYAATVLKQQGIVGLPKILRRVISCRPGAVGGINLP